uniref:protein FAM227B-like isoform X3 n=1 Tax=Pristiophorus japonicus TaxID=55135 RepID=UPI00398E94E4
MKMEKLPTTYEEYLQLQGLTDWPELLPDEDDFKRSIQPATFNSCESMSQYVCERAPFQMEVLVDIGQTIDQFASRLEKYSSKILPDKPSQPKIKVHNLQTPSSFLTQMKNADALLIHPSRKLSEELCLDSTVESQRFPGFKPLEFTELPGQIQAKHLLNWIRKAQNFHHGFQNTLKKLILSKASAAILQDAFWWFFLFKFEPSKEDQDHLFNRIADSFVTLFMITPSEAIDKLFEIYPDCVAQAIFAVFYRSFPRLHNKFGDEFKNELTELISVWMTGRKPEQFSWRKWNLEWLEKSMIKKGPDRKESILAALALRTTEFHLDCDLDELIKDVNNLTMKDASTPKNTAALLAEKESSYAGRGPEFRHILFRLSGRSPLVAHFLNIKKIVGRSLGTMGPKLKHIEISKDPPLAPTYQDVIKETKRFSDNLHQKNIELHEQTRKAIAKIKWDQIQFNKKIDRLKNELFNNEDYEDYDDELLPAPHYRILFHPSRIG